MSRGLHRSACFAALASDCFFGEFHTFEMTPLEQQGLITRLRSLPPRAIE